MQVDESISSKIRNYNRRHTQTSKILLGPQKILQNQLKAGMERRSNSKSLAKQQHLGSVQKNGTKRRKNSQANDRQSKYNLVQKKVKENLMFSLIEVFQESRNEPSLIVPWMKEFHHLEERIIGANYMIIGPSQSGKYSAVKFALGQFYPDVQEILINCDISTTEHQFTCKLLNEFSIKAPKCKWPTEEKEINKLITNDSIDFEKLNPFIIKGDLKFVIIIKNGQHLVGFKKQTMLYNLFEWMRSQIIQERGGLVILTRNLMLIDRFEKRVRSRFSGNRLTIFRPTQPQIYMKIIVKRIEAVIRDKQTWFKLQKLQNTSIEDENEVYNSDEDTNTRRKVRTKKGGKGKSNQKRQVNVEQFIKLRDKYQYVKQVCDYSEVLTQYLTGGFEQLGIKDFFIDKMAEFYNSKNKQQMVLYSDQSSLTVREQIECLYKIKKAIEKSTEILHYFKSKILQYQIITIPFVLRIFQHIFLTIQESIVKELTVDKLQRVILKLLEKNVQFEFPVNVIESNSLQSIKFSIIGLNNIELLLLIGIYKMILQNIYPIKLTIIHNEYRSKIHKQIHETADYESSKLPTRIIQQSIDRLYRSGIISYQPYNIWNSEISLLMEMQKIRKGLELLLKNQNLSYWIQSQLKSLGITKSSGVTQQYFVNLKKNDENSH